MTLPKTQYKVGDSVEYSGNIGSVVEITYQPIYKVKFATNYIDPECYEYDLDPVTTPPKYTIGDIVTLVRGKKFRTIERISVEYWNSQQIVYTLSGMGHNTYTEDQLVQVFPSGI